ncbi:MAG: hypothetical protein AAGN35_21570 [Bacteroidota bacterium]
MNANYKLRIGWIGLLLLLGSWLPAADIELDLRLLQSTSARLVGPGTDAVFVIPALKGFTGISAGDYTLELDVSTEISAVIRFAVGSKGAISNLVWRLPADTSTSILPASYYALENKGSRLRLLPLSFYTEIAVANDSLRLPQLDRTLTNGGSVALFPGTYRLTSGTGKDRSADFILQLPAATGSLSDSVYFADGDSTLSRGEMLLGPGLIYSGSDTLYLAGRTVYLNLMETDQALNWLNGPDGFGGSGWASAALLPGDYRIGIAGQSAELRTQIDASGRWSARTYHLPEGTAAKVGSELHGRFYTRRTDSLNLRGMAVRFDLSQLSEYECRLDTLAGENGAIPNGDSSEFQLLPGEFLLRGNRVGELEVAVEWRLRLDNLRGGLATRLEWKDHVGDQTSGTFAQFPPENAWLRQAALVIFNVPDGPKTKYEKVYAVPDRKPSGAWYQIQDGFLHFRYEGEYDPGQLQVQIMDWRRNIVQSAAALNLQKSYGENRFSVNTSSLAVGHYTLELTNEKNETFYIRFEKN